MSQPKFITNPSYDQLHNAVITMVREARTISWIDYVMAPIRGGLFFGVIASHKLNVPLITISYSSKDGKGDDKNHDNVFPKIPANSTVYLIDDIVDSGKTMLEIVDHYKKENVKVITSVCHFKEGAVYHPDLYFWRVPKDSAFITYPWESS